MDLSSVDEGWFEGLARAKGVDDVPLREVLNGLARAGRNHEAIAGAQHLLKVWSEAQRMDEALIVLEWLGCHSGWGGDTRAALEKIFGKDRNAMQLIEPSGFGGDLPMAECFKRLHCLRKLQAGMLCYNETWGVGIISGIDSFYKEIEVDFERKEEHTMAFSYAAEALEPLDSGHIMAVKYNQRGRLEEMLKKEPGEVVRMALQSYGGMPVGRLAEKLVPSLMPERDWKKFWSAARRALRNDASVEIPRKRSDRIKLYHGRDYGDAWFERVGSEHDIGALFGRFREIVEKQIDTASEKARSVLADRLSFIIKGAPAGRPEWKAEGLIYARSFGIEPSGLDTGKLIHDLIKNNVATMLDRLPSRQLQTLLTILIGNQREAAVARLIEVIPLVGYLVLKEIMAALIAHGAEQEVQAIMTAALARRKASASMLLWCLRSTEYVEKWSLISGSSLAFRIQEVLERNATGAQLKAQNQLCELFQQEQWLHSVMDGMDEPQRRDFMRRIHDGQGWDVLDRKSVVAKVLRRFPNLQDIVTMAASTTPKKELPLTSTRSYTERQKQLEKIMTVDIPEISKEIELARSYGDLRENAEFKYAKERQGLLMAQGAHLAKELERVKPSDFKAVSTNTVAAGTGVKLKPENGPAMVYYILGVWDQSDDLAIVSSETRLAQALMGASVGDQVEAVEGTCVLASILPLPDKVRAWIQG